MGDIGESAVLRYLIINEIRKVPAFKPNRELKSSEEIELAKRDWADMFAKGWVGVFSDKPLVIRDGVLKRESEDKEEELAKLKKEILASNLIGKNFGGAKEAEALIEGLDDDAISRVLFEGENNK
jgi:hypothetical protein